MASIARRDDGRWRARYRDTEGCEHSRHFTRRVDAQAWLDTVTTAVQTGTYSDPKRGQVALDDWARTWLDAQGHLKPSTRERYAGLLRSLVLPRWGRVPLNEITHADVQSWTSNLATERSPSTAVKAHRVLALVLALAVRDGRIARNPATGISLPREPERDRHYLTHAQVHELAGAAAENATVILFLAYTGLRFGEMAALRVRRLDLLRRRIEVAESVTAVNGELVWGTPKGHARRWVGVPQFVVDLLALQVAGKPPDDLVFTAPGRGPPRASNFRRDVFTPAAGDAGISGVTPHSLRHTAASLAIASGANVKVVQQMLGHKSATMTLDLYGHLFDSQLDDIADRLDAAARTSSGFLADFLRTFCGLTGSLPICPVEKKASEVSKYGASSGAPGQIRTGDARLRSPALYPLSYEGGEC